MCGANADVPNNGFCRDLTPWMTKWPVAMGSKTSIAKAHGKKGCMRMNFIFNSYNTSLDFKAFR